MSSSLGGVLLATLGLLGVVALVAFALRARRRRTSTAAEPAAHGAASAVAPEVKPAAGPAAGSGPIRLTAPARAVELFRAWADRWLLFAHRAAGIQAAADLDGKKLFIAWINTGETLAFGGAAPRAIEEAAALQKALGVTLEFVISNNAEQYPGQLLGDPSRIGMLVPAVAQHLGLATNPYLARLEFETAARGTAFACSACGNPLEEIGIPPAIEMVRSYGAVVNIGTEDVPAEIKADPFLYRGFFCRTCERAFCPVCSRGQGEVCPVCDGRSLLPAYRPLLTGVAPPKMAEVQGTSAR